MICFILYFCNLRKDVSLMNRDLKIDGLKSLMIFLVVLGHIHGYNDYGLNVTRIIFSFHMPVFVFISGFLTPLHPSKEKKMAWLKHTFFIYLFAQIAHVVLGCILGKDLSWRMIICPEYALWYLLCLIYWRISVWTIFENKNDIFLLGCSVFLALLSCFVPLDSEFSFQRAFAFYPFFILGLVFKKRGLMSRMEKIHIWYAVIVLLIGLVIAYFLPWKYMPKNHCVSWMSLFARFVQSFLALCLCLSIIRLSRTRIFEKLAFGGQYTLWIYIGHTYLIRIFDNYFSIKLDLIGAIIMALLICFGIGLIAYGYMRVRNSQRKEPLTKQ